VVTVYDVARRAGVSIATVSRALNDRSRVSEQTRARVLQVARELGYQPDDLARGLVGKATRTIALLLPDITNPFFPELVKGVQTVTDERGHLLLLCHNADNTDKAIDDLVLLRRKQVDGVIMIGSGAIDAERISTAIADLPVVLVDRMDGFPGASVVAVDHRAGARQAVEHLLGLGHRDIAHLAGPPNVQVSHDRQAGWVDALSAAGVDVARQFVVAGDFQEEGGYAGGQAFLAAGTGASAIFAANDLTAIGLLSALSEAGVRVPADISVVGFDGIHLAAYTNPKLTTVAQPIFQLGQHAAELLLDRLVEEEPRPAGQVEHVILETRMITGASAAPAREATHG
jgi:DNA-binding LacI/PurR family transcriptional regulator